MTYTMNMITLRRVCAYIVWISLAANVLHGAAHWVSGAPLTPLPPSLSWLGISVELFFTLGPLPALALLYTRRWIRWGAFLLFLTMLIAVLWGYGAHFLFASGDNVMAHMSSFAGPAFLISSVLVFVMPCAGTIAGIYTFIQTLRSTPERDTSASEKQS